MPRRNWTRDELIVAFNLYCRIPFGRIHNRNPEIISLAKTLGRTPSALSWKLANFARLDPSIKSRNLSGAAHGGSLEKEIWQEFNSDWDRLAFESEKLRFMFAGKSLEELGNEDLPEGGDREAKIIARVNQGFFRSMILATYNGQCCITGIHIPELLCASHIIPWSIDKKNRTNPKNGLCLNAFHDRAFDRGLISFDEKFRVVISPQLRRSNNPALNEMLFNYEGKGIAMPSHFQPDPSFVKFHFEKIFLK
jgi:putative restriction endonuclease